MGTNSASDSFSNPYMKTIGLSRESTVERYRKMSEEVKCRLGGLPSSKYILCSVDFAEMEQLQVCD
ncbi:MULTISPECIES: hypothetical protein [Heyndrickxia]|uniref:hypothetical protein n=2 Tax=Heyndrickxia TaxID=2837504 RepID=UPI00163A6D51